jgi:hypothetical protein
MSVLYRIFVNEGSFIVQHDPIPIVSSNHYLEKFLD